MDWGAKDGPADIVFFIAAPEGADQEHLQLLAKLARSLIKKDFTASLRSAATPQAIVELVDGALGLGPVPESAQPGAAGTPASDAAPAGSAAGALRRRGCGRRRERQQRPQAHTAAPTPRTVPASAAPARCMAAAGTATSGDAPASATGPRPERLVAVTACPTGIAHTYMAADSLAAAAAERGIDLQVETQGSAGSTPLDPEVIKNADAVIFAVDVDVRDKGRFAGKPLVSGPVKRGIDEPGVMIDEALAAAKDPNARTVSGGGGGGEERASTGGENFGGQLKRALLTGVSYMIPFVAGGGLLIALGFLLGGYELSLSNDEGVANGDILLDGTGLFNLPPDGLLAYLGAVFWKIGNISLGLPGPGAGRLHRLRAGGPPRHCPGIHCRRRRPVHGRRVPRRHRRAACSPVTSPCGWAAGRFPAGCAG